MAELTVLLLVNCRSMGVVVDRRDDFAGDSPDQHESLSTTPTIVASEGTRSGKNATLASLPRAQ